MIIKMSLRDIGDQFIIRILGDEDTPEKLTHQLYLMGASRVEIDDYEVEIDGELEEASLDLIGHKMRIETENYRIIYEIRDESVSVYDLEDMTFEDIELDDEYVDGLFEDF